MFGKKKFLDINGNFDSARFMQLLTDSRQALKTGKKPKAKKEGGMNEIVLGGVSQKEVWQLINKLGNFLNSGIDLKTAFGIVEKQIKNPKLRKIVTETKINLNHGLSITDTFKTHSKYFDPLVIALLEVGEKTGNLPRVLLELDKKLLENIELKSKIKGAMIYPVVLIFITIGMVVFMLTFILPKITGSFDKAGVELPWLTQFMINISNFLTGHYIILIVSVIVFAILFTLFKSTYYGKTVLGKVSINLPVFGYIARQGNVVLFINSLSLLLNSGVLVLEALDTTSNVVPNILFKKDIVRVKNEVETGIKFSSAMGLNTQGNEIIFSNLYFDEELVHMISVGEETGTISKSIEKVGKNYSKELKRYVSNLMTMLEPFIIVFIGFLVGTIVIAIMLPFFNLVKVAGKI